MAEWQSMDEKELQSTWRIKRKKAIEWRSEAKEEFQPNSEMERTAEKSRMESKWYDRRRKESEYDINVTVVWRLQ